MSEVLTLPLYHVRTCEAFKHTGAAEDSLGPALPPLQVLLDTYGVDGATRAGADILTEVDLNYRVWFGSFLLSIQLKRSGAKNWPNLFLVFTSI